MEFARSYKGLFRRSELCTVRFPKAASTQTLPNNISGTTLAKKSGLVRRRALATGRL